MLRPAGDSVYLTNAVAAAVGFPMIVMSITCGLPDLVTFWPCEVMVMVALAYCAASAKLPRLIAAGSLMYGRCSSMAWVMNALEASSCPDWRGESRGESAYIGDDVADPAGPPRIFSTVSDGRW